MIAKSIAAEKEWIAWRSFVTEFEKLYGDINDCKNDRMIKSVRYWGETLVQLRRLQTKTSA